MTSTTRALLAIDVQESFRHEPLWEAVSNPDVVDDVRRLVGAFRAAGDLVVWVLHAEPGSKSAFDPESGYVRVVDELDPRSDEPLVTKTSINAFTSTNLQQTLVSHGIGEIVICGLQTELCCETTARLASDLGYQVVFVTDATATFPIEHRNAAPARSIDEILADPLTLPVDALIERTEYALAGRFAEIRRVADLT
jgi:nicotinamidase-related amidase